MFIGSMIANFDEINYRRNTVYDENINFEVYENKESIPESTTIKKILEHFK